MMRWTVIAFSCLVVASTSLSQTDGPKEVQKQSIHYGTVATVPSLEHRARPDSYQQERTDEHGHFIVRGLNPGGYVVLAFEELQEDIRQAEFLKTYAGKGEKVEVEEGTRKSVTPKIIAADTEAP